MEKFIRIESVSHVFTRGKTQVEALRDINLSVRQGEFVSLIGHSGSGKSTLLNLVAGLTLPTGGVVLCGGREVDGPGPERAVVFQNHALLPWLTCFENVHLAVERVFGSREKKSQLQERTRAALALAGLSHAEHKLPREMTPGMRQAAGIARALATEPKVLLMDEPFCVLDGRTRVHLQDELLRIIATTGTTVVMATHDADEALILSDRIVMLSNGPGATLGRILDVNLERPRDRLALINHSRYLAHRATILRFLLGPQDPTQAKVAPASNLPLEDVNSH